MDVAGRAGGLNRHIGSFLKPVVTIMTMVISRAVIDSTVNEQTKNYMMP